jgi:hypothetical protein
MRQICAEAKQRVRALRGPFGMELPGAETFNW